LILTGTLLILLVGALVVAVVTSRNLVGAVPGKSPVLGLAALDNGFLVGTGTGVFVSGDGRSWSAVKSLTGSRALVADGRTHGVVLAKQTVWLTTDLSTFKKQRRVGAAVAVAAAPDDEMYVVKDAGSAIGISGDETQELSFSRGPQEIVAFAVTMERRVLLAGGLTSGLWETRDEGMTWRRLLKTPTRAILVDPRRADRILIATAGGILHSTDEGRSWQFTSMRLPVEALAESGGRFFALSMDRLVYVSTDGVSWSRIDA
jgi:hypothetical protein